MNKSKLYALALLMTSYSGLGIYAQNTPISQMEKLNRGLVVVPAQSGSGNFLSWRLLGTDPENTSFSLLRDGEVLSSNILDKTNYVDKTGVTNSKYQIITKHNGIVVDTTAVATSWGSICKQIPLDKPADGKNSSGEYSYTPNDCSVADVDGDGEYEIIVKWDPTNSKDNSQKGYTGNVFLDCYKLDGTKLWRIDLGQNIRAGAHYTQFLVYDFDGDGTPEMICKTAPGSKDGAGAYVTSVATDDAIKNSTDNTKAYANSGGYVNDGPEYLTVFNALTGKAIHTVWYNPNRAGEVGKVATMPSKDFWGDNYGGRSDRFLACVAYLDGADKKPSAVMCRGYYTRAYLWAVDFDGKELKTKWLHSSTSTSKYSVTNSEGKATNYTAAKATRGKGSNTAYANGNHNLSVADVDGDGCDEIVWGSCAINNDGKVLYATGYGHGDAIHVGTMLPDQSGLQVFDVHEEGSAGYGWDLHDAKTGEILLSATSDGDNGRGMAADIDATKRGYEFWSSASSDVFNAVTGKSISTSRPSVNFRIYWDGDLQDELFDGRYSSTNGGCTPTIQTWSDNKVSELTRLTDHNSRTCNTTKSTPCLQADIFGDWREEVIMWDGSDAAHLNVFTTNYETNFAVPTLMHDHVYRMGIAWQNTAYNQPPHIGYYLPDSFKTKYVKVGEGDMHQQVALGDSIQPIILHWKNCGNCSLLASIDPDGTEYAVSTMDGFTYKRDAFREKTITITGKPEKIGEYKFVLKSGKNVVDNSVQNDTIVITCVDATAIESISNSHTDWLTVKNNLITSQIDMDLNLTNASEKVVVDLYNAAGAKVAGTIFRGATAGKHTLSGLEHLTEGVYLLNVRSSEGTRSFKLIKR